MKILQVVSVLFLCVVASGFGQTNDAAFFRISSPSNAVITGFDPVAGTLTCSNAVVGTTNQLQRAYELVGTSNWVDFVQLVSNALVFTETIIDLDPPEGMAFIPGGIFQMGDTFGEGGAGELPVHSVYVSGFYMEKYEVTKALWDEVYNWATNHSYGFDYAGSGKAANHPVNMMSWCDSVKWCNARSEKEGRTPCYMVTGSVYRTGQSAPSCDWSADGYRLPTEAEWEKAARGGLNGKRFGWGDTISHSNANYYGASGSYSYDYSNGYHPSYDDGVIPYSSPVGSFSPNTYGLYDMAGNMSEWCWDWLDNAYYASSPSSNPRGPSTGLYRVIRSGGWLNIALDCRSAGRAGYPPGGRIANVGLRTVLPAD